MRPRPALLLTTLVVLWTTAALHAQDWPDARTARVIDRYVEVLAQRPRDGEVFRRLATLYDTVGRLDALSARFAKLPAAQALVLRGHLERYRGRLAEARAAYERALQRAPDSYPARLGLARTLEDLGLRPEAEAAYVRALERVADAEPLGLDVKDETAAICRTLGQIARDAGRADDARGYWDRLVALDPDDPLRREQLARILAENGHTDDAVRCYEKLIAMSADDPARRVRAMRDIGGVLEAAGRVDEAFAAYRRARDATEAGNWLRRELNGRILHLAESSGTLDRLETELAATARKTPDDVETWERLLALRTRRADDKGAVDAFRNLLRLRPADVALRVRYARHLEDTDDPKAAAGVLGELVRRRPKDPTHRFALARALTRSGDRKQALAVWQSIGADFAKDARVQLDLARVLEDAGEHDRAREALDRAIAAAPDRSGPYRELGAFEMRRGRRDEALKAWRRITQTRPASAEAWADLAAIYRRWEMSAEALDALGKAADLAPKDVARRRAFAEAAAAMGRFDAAVRAWEQVVELAVAQTTRDEAWTRVIDLYAARDRMTELRERYRTLWDRDRGSVQLTRRLGAVLERLAESDVPEGAAKVYEEFLKRHPKHPEMMRRLARVYPTRGLSERSIALYRELTTLDAPNARAYLRELVGLYLDLGRAPQAVSAAKRLTALYPLDASAHAELARVYEGLARYADAAASLKRALSLRSDDAELIETLSRVYEASGDLDALTALHRRVLRSSSRADACRESARRLITLTYGTKDFVALERLLLQHRDRNRRNFAAWQALAEYYRAAERPGEVLPLYERALDAVPASERAAVLNAMSAHCQSVGRIDEAIRYAEAMRSASSSSLPAETLTRLGGLYLLRGELRKGRDTLARWWRTDARNANVHRTTAAICLRHGDAAGAAAAYARLLALPPTPPGVEGEIAQHLIRLRMGGLYERLGRTDDAVKTYLEILEGVPGSGAEPPPGAGPVPFGAGISPGPLTPVPPGWTSPTQGATYEETRAKAIEGLVRVTTGTGRFEQLVRTLEARIARDTKRQQPYDDLARVLMQAGETDRMVKVLERARTKFPDAFDWRRDLARAYRQVGRYRDAITEYRAALQLVGGLEPQWQNEIVACHLKLGETDAVKKLVRSILTQGSFPMVTPHVTEVAELCAAEGKHALAAEVLTMLLKTPGVEPTLRLEIAAHLRRAGKTEAMVPHLRAFLDRSRGHLKGAPASSTLLVRTTTLGQVYRFANPAGLAALTRDLERVDATTPDDVTRLCDLAVLYRRGGRFADELRALVRVFDLTQDAAFSEGVLEACRLRGTPADARKFVAGALAKAKHGLYRKHIALAALDGVADLSPDDPLAKQLIAIVLQDKDAADARYRVDYFHRLRNARGRLFLAEFYWRHGRPADAIAQMRVVVENNPPTASALLRLAWYLSVAGERDEARRLAAQAAERVLPAPEIPGADYDRQSRLASRTTQLVAVIERFRSRGFLTALRTEFEKRLQRHPDEPTRTYDLSIVCGAAGDHAASLALMRRLAARRPDETDHRISVVLILQRMGRHDEAIGELETLTSSVTPPDRMLYDQLAGAYARAGRREAELQLRERMAVLFREPHALADVARHYRDLGMNDRAVTVFKRYVRLRYGTGVFYGRAVAPVEEYAQFLRRSSRAAEAFGLVTRTLAASRLRGTTSDETLALRRELAACADALGRTDDLIRTLEGRLETMPNDVETLDFLAHLHEGAGHRGRVIAVRRRLAELQSADVNNLSRLALTLRQDGRRDEAVAVYRKLLVLDPQNRSAYLGPVAEMYHEQGDTTRAIETVETLLDARADAVDALHARLEAAADLYGRLGLADREEAVYRRMVATPGSDTAMAYFWLARRHLERDQVDEACRRVFEGLDAMPSLGRRDDLLDLVVSSRTLREETIVRFAERLTASPTVRADRELSVQFNARLYGRLAVMGRRDLAVTYELAAWRADRRNVSVARQAAWLLVELGRPGEAVRLLEEARAVHPQNSDVQLELAGRYLASSRTAEADAILAELTRRAPGYQMHVAVGKLLADAGRWAEALEHFRAGRRLSPDAADAFDLEARALARLDRVDEAADVWDRKRARFGDEKTHLAAGDFFVSVGKRDRAEAAYAAALRVNPNSIRATQALGETLFAKGEYDACIALYRRACDVFQEKYTRADFLERLQRVYRAAGTVDAAVAAQERALDAADATWSRLSMRLAAQLVKEGRPKAAARIYRRLAQLTRDATMRREAEKRLAALEKETTTPGKGEVD